MTVQCSSRANSLQPAWGDEVSLATDAFTNWLSSLSDLWALVVDHMSIFRSWGVFCSLTCTWKTDRHNSCGDILLSLQKIEISRQSYFDESGMQVASYISLLNCQYLCWWKWCMCTASSSSWPMHAWVQDTDSLGGNLLMLLICVDMQGGDCWQSDKKARAGLTTKVSGL